jgi:hypothetical protein
VTEPISDLSWDDAEWMTYAACAKVDPEIFVPRRHREGRPARVRHMNDWEKAKSVCAQCPVLAQCLEYTLRTEPEPGELKTHFMFAAGFKPEELNEKQAKFDKRRGRRV